MSLALSSSKIEAFDGGLVAGALLSTLFSMMGVGGASMDLMVAVVSVGGRAVSFCSSVTGVVGVVDSVEVMVTVGQLDRRVVDSVVAFSGTTAGRVVDSVDNSVVVTAVHLGGLVSVLFSLMGAGVVLDSVVDLVVDSVVDWVMVFSVGQLGCLVIGGGAGAVDLVVDSEGGVLSICAGAGAVVDSVVDSVADLVVDVAEVLSVCVVSDNG